MVVMGQRHKYFPSHKSSFSAFLSWFYSKLSNVRFFPENPSHLTPDLASRNRVWFAKSQSNFYIGCSRGNVHSEAPPQWFEATEEIQIAVQLNSAVGSLIFPNKSGKSKKFNLQWVGAAWAEKRKMELEMEKRGEMSRVIAHPNGFLTLVEFGNLVARKNLENNLRWRITNISSLKVNLRCQLRYNLMSAREW
ncbi:hypothetical protein CIPAW_12G043400 [Carya illinoinensis]|uniref:Uncharacterized protein n=1 Tax=Carya illinoinensis TaxID=32201 RepID=A0A8T1NXD0_CARIL|nr:hypothetical protein CIPAW_12G043400 [Carya illinoinensis]